MDVPSVAVSIWIPYLVQGLATTIALAALAMLLALSFGLVLATAVVYGSHVARIAARTYIEVARGIPGLAMLYIVYFGLPTVGIVIPDAFWAAVLALGFTNAAYMAEAYRAGLESPDRGQQEAALALGMSRLAMLRYVILPQAIPVILPAVTNLAIDTLKDTTLASIVATAELMQHAYTLISQWFKPLEIYAITAVFYLGMGIPLAVLSHWLARRAQRGRRKMEFRLSAFNPDEISSDLTAAR